MLSAYSARRLLDKVWGDHVFIEERTVDVHVKRGCARPGAASVMVETAARRGLPVTAQPQVPLMMRGRRPAARE